MVKCGLNFGLLAVSRPLADYRINCYGSCITRMNIQRFDAIIERTFRLFLLLVPIVHNYAGSLAVKGRGGWYISNI